MAKSKLITPMGEDYSRWYTDVVTQARLADYSPVKGCMVIRPHGYTLWENMQQALDRMFKETGHQNAYFPLFIPKSFLAKEAEHVEGFAKECAIVTHSRLKTEMVDGKATLIPDPDSKLDEELIVRPTSETIIYHMFAKWVKSYRDLPILMNQWANVVRWEMRTRLFLRTTEFLWQEGHTAHATPEEAEAETRKMLDVYATFAEEFMAVPVLTGRKTDSEKFAGALHTYCIEALMQDNKALQAGTSHNLGQNFAKAFDLKFQDEEGKWRHAYNTSWGVSTRLVGAVIMAHGDDNGLVLPPKIAPIQVVIVPIYRSGDDKDAILAKAAEIRTELTAAGLTVELDDRDKMNPGAKFNEWEMLGVPLRIELGPKDLEKGTVVCARRPDRAKSFEQMSGIAGTVSTILDEIQAQMLETARERRDAATFNVDDYDAFKAKLDDGGGFLLAHWCGSDACEAAVQAETKATIRCITFDAPEEEGACMKCGEKSTRRVHFARAY
ncbi:MAG: proline--tRNA ligase [Acidobacteria bacterium]|uniref:Proline--tRNA ligase n=1 Tax=Candidatus Polarisedimenticola svalbardensis TaxID=2886004 RepID=A0A8J7C1D9_9BACT|nr:proline--tRNA ligase [Candidatus Polarisedimenticola svalbardensis]